MHRLLLNQEELYKKYITECLSQKKVADYFGVSVDTISANLKHYGIEPHKNGDFVVKPKICLNENQLDYLAGALLGDGCLYKHKRGVNAQFCYTSKSLQHVNFVSQPFQSLIQNSGITKFEYYDRRTNKVYTRYTMRTITDRAFLNEYEKWYINGVKHIPKCLRLNPVICLIWYLGDGCICHSRQTEYIKLSTQAYDISEQEMILLPQLEQFSAKIMKSDISSEGKQQYFIYIPRIAESDFLNYIGKCPFSDYSYKWDIKPYKKFVKERNPHLIDEMIKLFNCRKSCGTIAKELGVDRSTVVKYLSTNGYDCKENLFKRGN